MLRASAFATEVFGEDILDKANKTTAATLDAKFAAPGRLLAVDVDLRHLRRVAFVAKPIADAWAARMTDNGPGIPAR
jgi:hypothetical protein